MLGNCGIVIPSTDFRNNGTSRISYQPYASTIKDTHNTHHQLIKQKLVCFFSPWWSAYFAEGKLPMQYAIVLHF